MATSTVDEPTLPGGYLVTPRVPQGLAAAVEGLTREVIRNSPEDIYVFAAHHFEKLLHLREQCGGVDKIAESDGNLRALREMSQALKMREFDRGNVRLTKNLDQAGWSLNQTAKVLKRHRSIFGDAGGRISTDEVFRMANQKENRERASKSPADRPGGRANRSTKQKTSDENVNNLWKASTSRTERSWSNEDSADTNGIDAETRSGPRIISRISSLRSGTEMLAKDIKTELRKNRMSSRERRSVRAKPENRSTADKTECRAGKSTVKNSSSRKSSERQKRLETDIERRRGNENFDSARSLKLRQDRRSLDEKSSRSNGLKPESRALSMDRVKDYVVEKFATTKSLEELQSVNYVEKVQGIIDETGPIIKGKVDELKSGMVGRSKRSSWFEEVRNGRQVDSNESDGKRDIWGSIEHLSTRDSPGSRAPLADELKSRLTETQNLLENLSSSLSKPPRRSRSARSSRRTKSGTTIRENITNFKDSRDEMTASISDPSNRSNGLETRLSKTRNLLEDISSAISRPMRRSCSEKALGRHDEGTTDDSSDYGPPGDALKTRLDETRNLLVGLSETFSITGHRARSVKGSRHRTSRNANVNTEEISNSDSQSVSKVSLPAVRSISVKSSSGSVSRSDSGNLVLPAISPEIPKSAKIKEDLILPVLSPPGTASSNDDTKIGETADVLLEEFDIPEIPVEDYIPEAVVDDVFRDSLNVTPNFDSIPQRPDSLEPEDIPAKLPEGDGLKISEGLQNTDIKEKLRELEEAEKRIDRILDTEVCNESKDSPICEKHAEHVSAEVVQATGVTETGIERAIPIGNEENAAIGHGGFEDDAEKMNRLSASSPESLNYTYVLTEGSPYDIPDTVTTVIIPERMTESRESGVKCSPLPESALNGGSIEDVGVAEGDAEDHVQTNSSDNTKTEISNELDIKSPANRQSDDVTHLDVDNTEKTTTATKRPSTNEDETNKEDKAMRIQSDLFGEYVKPEMTDFASSDIDFIRGMDNRRDIQLSHQDLGRIKEEVSEELEGLDGREDGVEALKRIETIPESKGEMLEEAVGSDELLEETGKFGAARCADGEMDNVGNVGKSREAADSDLSPVAPRLELDSESSNEAKESSAADEPLGSAKCGISLEEEESSETRSVESSNEVKETTLTDGLSLSLDPMRPYVPELNLDSLQDITVSSFKMTEDEYDNQGKVESENSNSITETLTSDENHRMIDNAESAEEAVMEYIVSSADESKLEETHEVLHEIQKEVVEEPMIKSHVEIKEEICEKTVTYVTGSGIEEIKTKSKHDDQDQDQGKSVDTDDEEKLSEAEKAVQLSEQVADDGTMMISTAEQDIRLEEHSPIPAVQENVGMEEKKEAENEEKNGSEGKLEENVVSHSLAETKAPESPSRDEVANESTPRVGREVNEDEQGVQVPSEQGDSEIVEFDLPEERNPSENERHDGLKSQSSTEAEPTENVTIDEVANQNLPGDGMEEKKGSQDAAIISADENAETVEIKIIEVENTSKENSSSIEGKVSENPKTEDDASTNLSENECKDKVQEQTSGGQHSTKIDATKRNEHENADPTKLSNTQSDSLDALQNVKMGDSVEDTTSDGAMIADAKSTDDQAIPHSTKALQKSSDLGTVLRSGDDCSDEVVEESFAEEDTPLAVSRSASQCTTRRVSSGNLARLREDPSLSWTEEVGAEDDNQDDQNSSKIKFSKIGGETIKEQGSDEIDRSGEFDAPNNDNEEIDDSHTKDSKEYHIYVPDVDAGEDNSSTDSSTVESAVTKIQARVRGFLTRRRLHRGQHNRSSTLGSIPSIQDSIAVEPEGEERREETGISSPTRPEDDGIENYRRYKARNRLRREDAVQRTTLSLDKSFAESGLQHTGEFHDCVPLPIHDFALEKRLLIAEDTKSVSISETTSGPSKTDKIIDTDSNFKKDAVNADHSEDDVNPKIEENVDDHRNNLHEKVGDPLESEKLGQMFFGPSSNVPIIQFGVNSNISQFVDLVVLAKEEAALQSGYLNFITSVEDNDGVDAPTAIPMSMKNLTEGEIHSNDSFKEPLALSATPFGVVIEEITSSGADNFMKSDDPTMTSIESSTAPEVATESSGSARAPCASSEAMSMSIDGHELKDIVPDAPQARDAESGSPRVEDKVVEVPENSGHKLDSVKGDHWSSRTSSGEQIGENVVLPTESTIGDLIVSDNFSLPDERGLLGPESSVDSMECPAAPSEEPNSSRSPVDRVEKSAAEQNITQSSVDQTVAPEPRKEDSKDEERSVSNADESSSMLSFSLKVQDFLGLGSEDSMELHGKKPILEVTLTPADLMKSMSVSQESQLAGERIESPITMVQMAPERSESLQQEDLSENCCEDAESNGKRAHSTNSGKSDRIL